SCSRTPKAWYIKLVFIIYLIVVIQIYEIPAFLMYQLRIYRMNLLFYLLLNRLLICIEFAR
ncbi:MAG: hypothetical protein KBH23_06375, partial [Bacteroidaceae bacterium]|nr:hypothetical protein [Bacteroidaceae bacterium]